MFYQWNYDARHRRRRRRGRGQRRGHRYLDHPNPRNRRQSARKAGQCLPDRVRRRGRGLRAARQCSGRRIVNFGAATATPGASTGGASQKAKPKPKSAPDTAEIYSAPAPQPAIAERGNGAWAEGFADYEERDGLTIQGVGGIERTQSTAGFLAGGDWTQKFSRSSGLMLGVLGGYSDTKQKYSTIKSSNSSVSTPFPFFYNTQPAGSPPAAVFDFDVPHDTTSTTEQRSEGGSVGTYASYFSGGFFIDGLAKVDFNRLTRRTVGTDTFSRTFTRAPQLNTGFNNPPQETDPAGLQLGQNDGATAGGVTNVTDGNSSRVIVDGESNACFGGTRENATFELAAPSSDAINISQSADFRNYIVASTIGYQYDLNGGFFFEPTGTVTFTYSDFDGDAFQLGLADGHTLRLQGGGRIGYSFIDVREGHIVTTAVGGYLYSDVLVDGYTTDDGFSTGASAQDEGELRVLGTVDAQIAWLNGYALYAQGEVRGGDDYWGVAGKLGARVEW